MSPLETYHRWIEAEIRKLKFGSKPQSLYEPIRYLMRLGGKRMRPMLTLLSYAMFRNNPREIVHYAAAVEVFHNFTLMHDDIMDNAPLRRGKKTVHEKWNVNTAILSGDAMLVKAYEMFASLKPQQHKLVVEAFSRCATSVCEGQQWDMEFETDDRVSEAQYIEMIRLKTAALLGFSMELGAILANASARSREAARNAGLNMGIGFQLRDDLLDAFADPDKFGKQVGGDIIANKKTYLLIRALAKADLPTRTALVGWIRRRKFNKREKINAVKGIYTRLDIPSAVARKSDYYFAKAFSYLAAVRGKPGPVKTLERFARGLIERQV